MAEKRHLVMPIDVKRCIGCHTCAMACKVENNLPDGNWWNRVITVGGHTMDTPEGTYPGLKMSYLAVACQHCQNPSCAEVCLIGAIYKDDSTGIVIIDHNKCTGCCDCIEACPYTGVLQFNEQEPQHQIDFAVGGEAVPQHHQGVVEKCSFCYHRVARGEVPACIEVCPALARHFGNLNDSSSEVSKLLRQRSHFQLMPETGNNPSVYFLT